MRALCFVALASVSACKKASEPPAQGSAKPAGHPRLPASATLDQIIADAFAHDTVSLVQVDYVSAAGTLDRAHGKLMLRTIFPTDKRGAEAQRQLGGPITWNEPTMYAGFKYWTGSGEWKSTSGYGDDQLVALRPACTITQLWKRAIAEGAPADALARITLKAGAEGRPQHWLFTITDAPRAVFFRLEVPDDCPAIAEATP